MINSKPGLSLRFAIREDIKSIPRGMELAPTVMGVSHVQTVRNYTCETKRGTHSMSLDQFESLLEWSSGHNAAQAVAEMAGGVFIPTDEDELEGTDLVRGIAESLHSLSVLVTAIQNSVADGVVVSHEWHTIHTKRVDMIKALQRLVSQVKALKV